MRTLEATDLLRPSLLPSLYPSLSHPNQIFIEELLHQSLIHRQEAGVVGGQAAEEEPNLFLLQRHLGKGEGGTKTVREGRKGKTQGG